MINPAISQAAIEPSLPESPCRRGSLSGVKAVLFDLDDTWIDTFNSSYAVVRRTAERFQLPPPSEQLYRDSYGKSFEHMVRRWFPDSDIDIRAFRKTFELESQKTPTPRLFDVAALVTHLLDQGVKVGVVTNSSDERTLFKLKAIGIDPDSLSCIITQDTTGGVLKPHPRGLNIACTQLTIEDRTSVLFVGNAIEDQEAALRAGVYFCAVERLEDWERDLHPDSFFLESAARVVEILDLA